MGVTDTTLRGPISARSDGTLLVIGDSGNYRVLIYPTFPTSSGTAATLVVGQPNMTSNAPGSCTSTSFNVFDAIPVNGDLIVTAGLRALVFNPLPVSSNPTANYAIGDTGPSCPGGAMLSSAQQVYTDGTRLVVADTGHHRVLIWNTFPITDTVSPDLVLGQPAVNPGSVSPNAGGSPSAQTLSSPSGVTILNSHLYVADTGNNRVLVWNTFPTTNQQAADKVLGQADFTSVGAATTAAGLSHPAGLATDSNNLYVSDSSNNRVVVYGCQ